MYSNKAYPYLYQYHLHCYSLLHHYHCHQHHWSEFVENIFHAWNHLHLGTGDIFHVAA